MRILQSANAHMSPGWSTMYGITIQPSEKSVPPDRTGTLPSKTVYYVWRAQCADGGHDSSLRPTAILILQHGHAEYARRYLDGHNMDFFSRLRRQGVEIWALDLWGHGCSPGTRGVLDLRKAVNDHIQLRTQVAESLAKQHDSVTIPVFLFGHGLGGLITAGSLVQSPDTPDVAGLLLSAPLIKRDPLLKRMLLSFFANCSPTSRVWKRKPSLTALSRIPDQVEHFLHDPLRYDGYMTWSVRWSASAVAHQVWKHADRWLAPTCAFMGTDDVFVRPEQVQALLRHISATDKKLELIAGGRHEPLRDLGGKNVEDALITWLGKRWNPP